MKKGLFITFEGPDGSGKSTQIEKLSLFFRERGQDVVVTREPGGTPIGEKIRAIILDKENTEMNPMTEALLYAASRAQHVAAVIKPALEKGSIVICDRFADSSMAYQGFGRKLGDSVEKINHYAVMDCVPDITFLLKLNPKIGSDRIRENERDRMELEKAQFHQDVYQGYMELEKKYSDRIVGIDADRSIEEISSDILARVEQIINEF